LGGPQNGPQRGEVEKNLIPAGNGTQALQPKNEIKGNAVTELNKTLQKNKTDF
jgi:hypothetical protein